MIGSWTSTQSEFRAKIAPPRDWQAAAFCRLHRSRESRGSSAGWRRWTSPWCRMAQLLKGCEWIEWIVMDCHRTWSWGKSPNLQHGMTKSAGIGTGKWKCKHGKKMESSPIRSKSRVGKLSGDMWLVKGPSSPQNRARQQNSNNLPVSLSFYETLFPLAFFILQCKLSSVKLLLKSASSAALPWPLHWLWNHFLSKHPLIFYV